MVLFLLVQMGTETKNVLQDGHRVASKMILLLVRQGCGATELKNRYHLIFKKPWTLSPFNMYVSLQTLTDAHNRKS